MMLPLVALPPGGVRHGSMGHEQRDPHWWLAATLPKHCWMPTCGQTLSRRVQRPGQHLSGMCRGCHEGSGEQGTRTLVSMQVSQLCVTQDAGHQQTGTSTRPQCQQSCSLRIHQHDSEKMHVELLV